MLDIYFSHKVVSTLFSTESQLTVQSSDKSQIVIKTTTY